MSLQNIFTAPDDLPGEVTEILAQGKEVRIERIVSRGHASPPDFWYDQDEHEWVMLLSGKARLEFDSHDELELVPGDYLLIPAHQRHRVAWTTPETDTIWLAIFYQR